MKRIAQSTIEFTIGFVITILFLIITCNLFVWFNNCLVKRQAAYEDSRAEAANGNSGNPGKADFYKPPTLNIFSPGGR